MRSIAHKMREMLSSAVMAATCGGLAGAVIGAEMLLYYSFWREFALVELRTNLTSATGILLRQLGPPPPENLLLLFLAVAIGVAAGLAVRVWTSARARFLANKITGANAGGPCQLPMRTRPPSPGFGRAGRGAHVAQFCRSL
jgi:hypothetical protein